MRIGIIAAKAAVIAILAVVLVSAVRSCRSLQVDRKRLLQNQSVLLHNGQVEIGQTRDGRSRASVPAVTLRPREFANGADALPRVARSMGVRPSRVRSAATIVAVTSASVAAPSSSASGVAGDTVSRLSSPLAWSDPWLTLSASIRRDSVSVTFQSSDTLDIVVHRVPRRFLFFRFGCKGVRMDVSSRNPHTRLVYARYYQLAD